jgi:hypothetical protein
MIDSKKTLDLQAKIEILKEFQASQQKKIDELTK